ncbi:MAG: glycosyltransferase [Dokdonia sp.]|jgi:glycosyltransferase involved in cell wall biosynthesis
MEQPLVSICIPTYNGAAFLQEALDSILAQTYPNLEVIISDDASQDATMAIVNQFTQDTDLAVTTLAHTPNGIGANWNNSIRAAKGKYIKFLFQDDVLLPDCVSEMVAVLETHPEVGLVGCKREFIVEGDPTDDIQKWIDNYGNLQRQFETDAPVTMITSALFCRLDFFSSPLNKIGEPPTTMFRTEILDEVGYFQEDLKQILDYVFYYRVLKKHAIAIINKPLVQFRIHPNQATNVNRQQKISDYERYDRILYDEFYALLHRQTQDRLRTKFHVFYKGLFRLKRKINKWNK